MQSAAVVHSAVRELERRAAVNECVTALRYYPPREARLAPFPEWLDRRLVEVFRKRGIQQLYSHQAAALEAIHGGRNAVVVTPTASGKTLCYNLPVLDRLLRDPGARAIYLFPTKALSRDQMDELNGVLDELGPECGLKSFVYDGDTPQDARRAIRGQANVVITNPDMLHAGILPHHTRWAKLFENLHYVVLDELHTYRGVFGSHLANVLRRLRRIAEFYGSKPQFVCSSATIANPGELAAALIEQPVEVIAESGAPSGEKYFVFYNPPVVNRQLGIRRSYVGETRNVALNFLARGLQLIVFANSRLVTEILVTYLKDACQKAPHARFGRAGEAVEVWSDQGAWSPDAVQGYRGGYLPEERRAIERALREGLVRGVVSTNALELGIDIGTLDVALLAGYPGNIAATWQRAGRAGRRTGTSAAVLIASSAPLDQFIIQNPDYFFGQSPEHGYICADNLEILVNHLKCAAFELPLRAGEAFGRANLAELCGFLEETGFLHRAGELYHWASEAYPADAVSLRSVTSDNFVVVDTAGKPDIIGEVDFTSALTTVHEKAIYLHQGRQYYVERFDYKERKAYVKAVEVDYFTDAISYTQVKILEELNRAEILARAPVSAAAQQAGPATQEPAELPAGALPAARAYGEVQVRTQVVGFKKIKFYTMENVGSGELTMPEQEMHTTAYWLSLSREFMGALPYPPSERQGGVTALSNALRSMATLLVMCDPRDLGVAIGSTEELEYAPNIYLFDRYPGGIGLSEPLFALHHRLIEQATRMIEHCPCESGCPSCVGPAGEVGARGKEVALFILRAIHSAEKD
jgi:DEAD/DEAH box helicase domain-containing protein